jgi:hypothetical protein
VRPELPDTGTSERYMPTTAWVKAPKKISGQDHLGTIAACEALYSQLLPGITNVTPRARAYAFYPWLAWSIDQLGLPKDRAFQIDLLRRAECLWCLIAIHHENGTADSWAVVSDSNIASIDV